MLLLTLLLILILTDLELPGCFSASSTFLAVWRCSIVLFGAAIAVLEAGQAEELLWAYPLQNSYETLKEDLSRPQYFKKRAMCGSMLVLSSLGIMS